MAFLEFLSDHLGGPPDLRALADLAPADIRAYLARRSADGIRTHLDRTGDGDDPQLLPLPRPARAGARTGGARGPHAARRRSLPKPLTERDALDALATVADLSDEPWVACGTWRC